MKPIIIMAALAAALSVQAQEAAKTDSVEGFKFTDVKTVKTGPVRDQNKSGTCWCFSSNSFFENEIIRKGHKPVDLSEMFVVWHTYDDKADKYIRTNGKINFSQGGSGLDVPYVWAAYGMMPEEAYKGLNYGEDNHVHGELEAAMQGYLSAINRKPNRRLSTAGHTQRLFRRDPPDIRIRGQDLHSPDIRTVARHQSRRLRHVHFVHPPSVRQALRA